MPTRTRTGASTGLRPRCRVVIEADDASTERLTLLACHVRIGGEATPHVCNICLSTMRVARDCAPNWVQAPCCGEVWHERCITRYTREAEDHFLCPQCKTKHSTCAVNEWTTEDVLARIFPIEEEEYVDSAFDDDDDDEHAGARDEPNVSRRHTRSRGAPETWKRHTRSSGTYL